jgi:hydroxymethylpyrimidine pyrophosphatase-like HAD family hydrolase
MRLSVLALDYDGTIARDGALDPRVRQAITEARARGIIVVLVTGRILSDLLRVAGDLQFADAVIAENGAVLAFPNGQSRLLGQSPPPVFVEELRRRGIEFTAGHCVLEGEADFLYFRFPPGIRPPLPSRSPSWRVLLCASRFRARHSSAQH